MYQRSNWHVEPCMCGLVYGSHGMFSTTPCCSSVFAVSGQRQEDGNVDCTLSLGTPSTRHRNTRSLTTTRESLLARRCTNCDTTSTPLWRNGPRGPKSLCNACGIRYKKEERRTHHHHHNSPWSTYATTARGQATSPALATDQLHVVHGDGHRDGEVGVVPFLSWSPNTSREFQWSQVSSMT